MIHVDGSVAACSLDEDDACAGIHLRHEGDRTAAPNGGMESVSTAGWFCRLRRTHSGPRC